MQNIFTNIKCSEIILYNANENWYIILFVLFSRLCYIATCGPFCKDATHFIYLHQLLLKVIPTYFSNSVYTVVYHHILLLTMTMTMTTFLLNINTGYKLEYAYNMIY